MRFIPLALIALIWYLHAFSASIALAADEKSIVSGTVYFDRNRNGAPDGENGLRGVQVTLTGPKGSKRDTTDSKGGYSFSELPAGQYTISIVPPAQHQITSAATLTVKLDGKNTNRSLDFGVASAAPTPSPTPSPSPTPRVTATPTVTATPSNVVQRPAAAASPLTVGDTQTAIQAAVESRARILGSPEPVGSPEPEATPTATASPSPSPTATPEGGRGGVPETNLRLRAASLEPLRYAAGRGLSSIKRFENAETIWLGVPFRTQMDGTYFAQVNCGPASLSMALGAFGISLDPHSLREYVNYLSGNLDPDSGTSLDHIARVAREAGLRTLDLYGSRGYRAWDLDLIREHVAQGHPVITLTRYQSLPGNASSLFNTDHYIVITGLSGDDFIYNDSAYGSSAGYGLLISGPDLERAWVFSSIPGHAVALALDGDAQVPDWVRRRASTAAAPPAEETTAESETADEAVAEDATLVGQVPGDQPLPEVSAEALALALLDTIAAPRMAERAFIAESQEVLEPLADDSAAAVLLPPDVEAAPEPAPSQVRFNEVFIVDPALVTLFLALLGIFVPPALGGSRFRIRR